MRACATLATNAHAVSDHKVFMGQGDVVDEFDVELAKAEDVVPGEAMPIDECGVGPQKAAVHPGLMVPKHRLEAGRRGRRAELAGDVHPGCDFLGEDALEFALVVRVVRGPPVVDHVPEEDNPVRLGVLNDFAAQLYGFGVVITAV